MTKLWCEHAWLGGPSATAGVLLDVADGRVIGLGFAPAPPASAQVLRGLTLPGLANAHSHAFHRALRGRTHQTTGSFWTWRELMYQVAALLDPDSYFRLARAVYAEMALAGITVVGEFHYLHHGPGGTPYANPNAMAEALGEAAGQAGVRLTLLDTCYLVAGVDRAPLTGPQLRFGDAGVAAYTERAMELAQAWSGSDRLQVGGAIHSVRAVADPAELAFIGHWAREESLPLHVHSSEQPKEVADCLAVHGRTPTAVLAHAGVLGPNVTAVHATHLTEGDLRILHETGAGVCFCPTTERDLADGIGPAGPLMANPGYFCLGSDSHAVIDLFEEARAVELDERLRSGVRGNFSAERLLRAATVDGHHALGWPKGGKIQVGAPCDITVVALDSPRTAGCPPSLATAVFAATAADVREVFVAGKQVVQEGRHLRVDSAADVAVVLHELLADL